MPSTTEAQASLDALWVQKAQRGEVRAFEWLVRQYHAKVERLVRRTVKDPALAADVVQEVFLSAYKGLAQFRGESAFYTWLYRIAVNAAKKANQDWVREQSFWGKSLDDEPVDGPGGDSDASHQDTPEAYLASQQVARTLDQALSELPPAWREALTLRELEGKSYEDIALLTQCPPGTVRSRIYRAREALARALQTVTQTTGRGRW